jgi:hypothetical protein
MRLHGGAEMDIRWAAVILFGVMDVGRADAAEKIQVDIYLQKNNWPQPMMNAEGQVTKIFGKIDVNLTWHAGELPAVRDAGRWSIGIRMVERAPLSQARRALASARPYGSSGSLISVYEDRVQPLLNDFPSLSRVLLGYIFAHELAHMMQQTNDHSDSGILKAQWSNADYFAMRDHQLGFTDLDSDRIRDGLAVRLSARQAK